MAQINKPNTQMNTVLYTGNGGTQSITGVGFQPNWTWLKARSESASHEIFDVVRGVTKTINSNTTNAEATQADSLTAFDSDGFTLGSNGDLNYNGSTYVGWNWKAGGSPSSNTDGTITSSVSANTTAGFSIVSYGGNSTTGATVGHGLSTAPKMIIIKSLGVENWEVYHESLGNTKGIYLNEVDAAFPTSARWNNTSPTSSVWTMGSTTAVNGSGIDYVAYCFADVKGFSKFGSYVGNGNADGTFVYTGMKPSFIMVRSTGSGQGWNMFDNKRDPFNLVNEFLIANSSNAEATGGALNCDFLSNGFKLRGSDGGSNASGSTYIYMAFAENPLVGTNGVPATAR